MGSNEALKNQLKLYKRKFYRNKIIKGSILFAALSLGLFLLINTVEFSGRLGSIGRGGLLYGYIGAVTVVFCALVGKYLLILKNDDHQISNEEAAQEIGKHFPEVSDKLLNIIQLEKLSSQENELLIASIRQKSTQIQNVPFIDAIDLRANRKYLKYVYAPVSVIILLLIVIPQFITESSTRIINYNTAYIPEAPFAFQVSEESLKGFANESHNIEITTEGTAKPEAVFIKLNERRIKAEEVSPGQYQYNLPRLAPETSFSLEADGITSPSYEIEVLRRPNMTLFTMEIDFPTYTGQEDATVQNSGNLTIPEGSKVTWRLTTENTESAHLKFERPEVEVLEAESIGRQLFSVEKTLRASSPYNIQLKNPFSGNRDSLKFQIDVIKDRFPEIILDQYQDTVLYKNVVLAGNIKDDYGFSRLDFYYSYNGGDNYERLEMTYNPELTDQSYYHIFTLDSARIKAGSTLSYYMQVSDNDEVNGRKSRKSATYSFKIPSLEELEAEIEKSGEQIQNKIDQTLKEAQELKNKIDEADEKLKTQKRLEWQDEKLMQEILDQKEKLAEKIDQLKKENQRNNQKLDQFKPQNDDIKQKMEQLQDIMDSVLDEETKRLYEELRELLQEEGDIEEFREKMDQLKDQSGNLEEDLERTLELFKKLQFDMKLEDNIEQLQQEIDDQERLTEETENGEKTDEELADQQKQEQEDLEKLKEELDKLNELNQDRKNPEKLPEDLKEDLEEAQEDQQKAEEELRDSEENQNSEEGEQESGEQEEGSENEEAEQQQQQNSQQKRQNASQSQKRASQKMKQVKSNLESMQSGMQMEQMQENLEHLRDLVDNLVTLSFNQEDLMNEFKEIRPSDPRYVKLSQDQLKLKDDSQIIQDSLVSLSQRVFQISSFVMRELGEMNRQMDGTIETLKEKRISQAVGKQQFTMTAINNLALLLDDVLQQMQEQMASQMGMGKSGQKQSKNMPQAGGLSDLQKKLSEQISDLKGTGKSGRELSQELARLAAQQERLRNALENFETGLEGNKLGEKIDKLVEQMEENEWDLINKNITDETIERQKEILTRLLDAENSMKERGEDEERKGNTALDYDLSIPESLNEYLKAKEKEIELLRTIPAKLNPYYKKETSKYFKKIKENN